LDISCAIIPLLADKEAAAEVANTDSGPSSTGQSDEEARLPRAVTWREGTFEIEGVELKTMCFCAKEDKVPFFSD
jgi:hypothetical protein